MEQCQTTSRGKTHEDIPLEQILSTSRSKAPEEKKVFFRVGKAKNFVSIFVKFDPY